MATSDGMELISLVAEADLSAKRYCFVKAGAAAEGMVLSVAGNNAIGVLQDKPVSGQAGAVAIGGKVPVLAGGNFSVGDLLASDVNGAAVLAATGDYAMGTAATAGAAGMVSEIVLDKQGVLA